MQKALPILAVAFLGLGWSLTAQGEEATPRLTHPADPTQAYQSMETIDPFSLAVPLLKRVAPTPSYARTAGQDGHAPSANPAAMPSMDHSNMPGMDHGNMPGMSGN